MSACSMASELSQADFQVSIDPTNDPSIQIWPDQVEAGDQFI